MPARPGARRLTRHEWLIAAAGAGATLAGAYAFGVEPRRMTITHHQIGEGTGPVLRLVQLSDLHLRAIGRPVEQIAEAVHTLRPDALVLTGDAVDHPDRVALLSTFLGLLPPAPHRLAILGNWEHWARLDLRDVRRRYDAHGWRLLENASARLTHAGAEVQVTGLDDLVGGRPDYARAVAGAAPNRNHLLLAHCPMQRDQLLSTTRAAAAEVNEHDIPHMMLSGHTHGGQFALGGWAPLRPPGSGRYVAGWYRDTPVPLYVSRGLGTSIIPARFGAPPEIAVFDWTLTM